MCKMGARRTTGTTLAVISPPPSFFSAPKPSCCCETGTSPQDGFAPVSSRTHGSHSRAHEAARGAPRGRTGPPFTRTTGGGPAAAPSGPQAAALGQGTGAGYRARPSAQQRPPSPPRRPVPSCRSGVTYRSAEALIAPRRGKAWRSPTADGWRKRRGRTGAEPHRCPHRTAPSSPPVRRGSRTAQPLPPHFRTGRGHAVPRRAASIRGLARGHAPHPPHPPPTKTPCGAGREAAVGTGVAGVDFTALRGRGSPMAVV